MPRLYRKVIQIRAVDSPNVRHALDQQARGEEPDGAVIVPGVLTWDDYQKRLATWDVIRRTVGLDAEFYEGPEVKLYPAQWLAHAGHLADKLRGQQRHARAIGCDPAEGGDKSAWAVVDELGLIALYSYQTPDTTAVPAQTLALMREYGVSADRVCLDRGGGGKQHADRLREMGFPVRTVAFGESLTPDPKRGMTRVEEKIGQREEHYAYVNRRAQMYAELSQRLDPSGEHGGFAIAATEVELRRQMGPVPKLYDREGRIRLLPKNKRDSDSTEKTLTELLGCSPDELDALVLALHAMTHRKVVPRAGVS